jgi:hypothetical protein
MTRRIFQRTLVLLNLILLLTQQVNGLVYFQQDASSNYSNRYNAHSDQIHKVFKSDMDYKVEFEEVEDESELDEIDALDASNSTSHYLTHFTSYIQELHLSKFATKQHLLYEDEPAFILYCSLKLDC